MRLRVLARYPKWTHDIERHSWELIFSSDIQTVKEVPAQLAFFLIGPGVVRSLDGKEIKVLVK